MKKKNIENNIGKGLAFAPNGITLISLAISRKCVRYEERA